jgi:hypothetical protein
VAHQSKGHDLRISKILRLFHFSHQKVPLSPKNHYYVDIDFVVCEFSFINVLLYSPGKDNDFDVSHVGFQANFILSRRDHTVFQS